MPLLRSGPSGPVVDSVNAVLCNQFGFPTDLSLDAFGRLRMSDLSSFAGVPDVLTLAVANLSGGSTTSVGTLAWREF